MALYLLKVFMSQDFVLDGCLTRSSWINQWIVCELNCVPSKPLAFPVKHLPAMRETWVQSLGWEEPLDRELATHFSTLAWKIPWTKDLGRLQSMVSQRV